MEIIYFILPRLKYFKETLCGVPMGMTEEEWKNKLDSYIETFQNYLQDGCTYNDIKPALHDFIEYLPDLWT